MMLLQITAASSVGCDRHALWVAALQEHSGCLSYLWICIPIDLHPCICTQGFSMWNCSSSHSSLPLTVACLRWGWALQPGCCITSDEHPGSTWLASPFRKWEAWAQTTLYSNDNYWSAFLQAISTQLLQWAVTFNFTAWKHSDSVI